MAEEHSFDTALANLFITVLYDQTRKSCCCAGEIVVEMTCDYTERRGDVF